MSDARLMFTVSEDSEAIDRVRLQVAPLARICPDGATLEVYVYHDERTYHDRERGNVREQVRVASVSLVDADGARGAGSGASVRFAGTLASPTCWARVDESRRYDRIDTGEDYFRVTSATAWRADGFADDLPDGARRAFYDVVTAAVEYVAEHFPYLWQGAEEKSASKRVADAESALSKARTELADAKRALKVAAKAHERAELQHAKKTGRAPKVPA